MSSLFFKNSRKNHMGPARPFLFFKGGFTLVEMMVTLSIFALITGVMLARYKDFNGGIVLTNLAYEIAITIRQAQVYGLSVRGASATEFNSAYGIHIVYPTNNTFILFADLDKNGLYTVGASPTENVELLSTSRGNTIDDFCAVRILDNGSECGKAGQIDSLDIMFLRPNPEAKFKTIHPDLSVGEAYKSATITVKSPTTGRTKTITVQLTGQISVQ